MKRFIYSAALALAVFAWLGFFASWEKAAWAAALGSLFFSAIDAWEEGVLSFLLVPLALAPWALFQPSTALLPALAIALTGRLWLWRWNNTGAIRNTAFAQDLKSLLPESAIVFVDTDIEAPTKAADLQEGHLIRVQAGDRIPTDGQITFGSGVLEEQALDGSPEPRAKGMGAYVFGGSTVRNGSFLFRASCPPALCFVSRLAGQLGQQAPRHSLGSVGLDVAAVALAWASYRWHFGHAASALLAAGGAGFVFAQLGLGHSFRARSAALGLFWGLAPTKVAGAGMLVCGDTGLLTEGRLKLASIEPTESTGEDAALLLAAAVARRIENPAAFALLQELQRRNIPLEPIEEFSSLPSGGRGLVGGEEVSWQLSREAPPAGALAAFVSEAIADGGLVYLLFRGAVPAAAFVYRDRTHAESSRTVRELEAGGLPVLLVANEAAQGEALGKELGLRHVHAPASTGEQQLLLEKLVADGLRPLVFMNLPFPPPAVPGLAYAAPAWQSEAKALLLLRGDSQGLLGAIHWAKRESFEQSLLLGLSLAGQIALAFCPPLWAAPLALLPAALLAWRAQRLAFEKR